MGSSDSSTYNKDFTYLSSCGHSNDCKFTRRIYSKRIPLPGNTGLTVGRVFGGIFTLGLSEAGYGIYKKSTGAGDGLTHYYLEMDFECSECGRITTYTIDFGRRRKKFREGYFRGGEIRDRKNGYWSYNTIRRIFDNMYDKFNQTTWNCQHFARYMFYKKL